MDCKLPLVVCTWNDAWVRAEEPITLAEVKASHKPLVIKTLGYLLLDDEVGVSLANEYYDEDGTYRGRTFVHRPMVISVKRFRLTKERGPKVKLNPESPTVTG